MIQIHELYKKHRRKTLLSNVSLQIPFGVFGLIGNNKSGKTALLKILATLESFTSGELQIFDYDMKIQKNEVKPVIGYLPQKFDLFPNMTAYDALSYFWDLKDIKDTSLDKEQDIMDCLSYVQLTNEKELLVHKMSPNQKQRLGIAQAFLGDPKLVLLDEPTNKLSSQERILFLSLLSKIKENRTVIMSTNSISDIKASCKNFAVFQKGVVKYSGNFDNYAKSLTKEVYSITIRKEMLTQFMNHVNVISLKQIDNKLRLRYMNISDQKIKINSLSKQVTPTIIDAYAYHTDSWLTKREAD